MVTDSIYAGAPFEAVANENHETTNVLENYNVEKCNRSGCLTCKCLITSKIFYSNHSKRSYKVINHTGENLSCKSSNIVYLLTCEG